MRIEIAAWNDRVVRDMEKGRIHLAAIGAQPAEPLESEPLSSDEFVCVVARNHPLGVARMTLKRYLRYEHAVIAVGKDGGQPWIERALEVSGVERRVAYRSPYQLSAILATSRK